MRSFSEPKEEEVGESYVTKKKNCNLYLILFG
jgi:hypothetical protein